MRKSHLAAGVGLLAIGVALAVYVAEQPPSVSGAGFVPIRPLPARYLADVTYLASDALKGRGDGSPELDQAADYIAAKFREAGLQPAGDNGTYFQNFEITTGAQLGAKNELRIAGA